MKSHLKTIEQMRSDLEIVRTGHTQEISKLQQDMELLKKDLDHTRKDLSESQSCINEYKNTISVLTDELKRIHKMQDDASEEVSQK